MILFDLLYIILLIATLPFWAINVFFKKEYREIFKHRFSPDITTPGNNNKRIWIHAVSVGEVRSIKELIHQLKDKYEPKGMEILLSVTTKR